MYLQNTVEYGKRSFTVDIPRFNTYMKQNENTDKNFNLGLFTKATVGTKMSLCMPLPLYRGLTKNGTDRMGVRASSLAQLVN